MKVTFVNPAMFGEKNLTLELSPEEVPSINDHVRVPTIGDYNPMPNVIARIRDYVNGGFYITID